MCCFDCRKKNSIMIWMARHTRELDSHGFLPVIARGCDTDIPSFRDHAWMVSKILLSRSTYYTGDNSSPNFTNWSLSICYYLLPMDRVPVLLGFFCNCYMEKRVKPGWKMQYILLTFLPIPMMIYLSEAHRRLCETSKNFQKSFL